MVFINPFPVDLEALQNRKHKGSALLCDVCINQFFFVMKDELIQFFANSLLRMFPPATKIAQARRGIVQHSILPDGAADQSIMEFINDHFLNVLTIREDKEEQHSDHAECCGGDAVICLLELRF